MDITLQNHTYPLTKSCLDVDSLKQLLDDFCREETEIRHFESDELCIICLRKPASVPLKYCRNDYDRGRLLFARQYLLDHITRPPSIEDLARIAGINSFKLKNGFKELFQETVYGYLNKYRLEKAKQLILCEEKNMTQISFELGFSSLQHFSTAFKKAYGCTPKKIKTVVQHTDLL